MTTAVVTGASSGIGEATARRLAAAGADLALVARRPERLERLASELTAAGVRAEPIVADLTAENEARSAIGRAAESLGGIDALVNNAGVMLLGPVVGAQVSDWRRMVDINVLGLMYCANAALPHLLSAARDGPRRVADMVNVSSVAGRVARRNVGVYNATKFAVGAFSESLRQEVAGRGIRVSLVEPGMVDTELLDHNTPEIRTEVAARYQGVRRLEAADVAETIRYVVSCPPHVALNEILIRPTNQEP
jgi:NADP-dependent 3-hydroxy acid dehydrogenase YdfG